MEDLQSLLEKINRDGVEKAEAEAKRIIDEAKAKAEALIRSAREEADQAKAEADKAAEDYAKRAAETIRQSARDTVISVQDAITKMLEKLLAQDVDAALANPQTAAGLAAGAIEDMARTTEVLANSKLVAALKAQFAAQPNITVTTDEAIGSGFTVKVDGGRVDVLNEQLLKKGGHGIADGKDRVAGGLAERLLRARGGGGCLLAGVGLRLRGRVFGVRNDLRGLRLGFGDDALGLGIRLFDAFAVDFFEQTLQVFHVRKLLLDSDSNYITLWGIGQVAAPRYLVYTNELKEKQGL